MFSRARILVSTDSVKVRFENVGDQSRFNSILLRFNRTFPLKEWDATDRV